MSLEINEDNFIDQVVHATAPVLIDFHAVWCGPCKMVAPILEEIANERTDLKIVQVDVDQNPRLAQQHKVMGVPTMILYKGGKMLNQWVGLRPKALLLKEIDAALASV
jgi:thioredoxin 1